MVRPASRAWEWVVVLDPRSRDKPHPDVRCSFCPKIIKNASLSRNFLPHLAACRLAPATVAVEAKRLLEAASSIHRPPVSPARRIAEQRLSLTPTRHRGGSVSINRPPSPLMRSTNRLDRNDANAVRLQIARTVFAANLPFRCVQNPEMHNLLTALAPPGGVPSRQSIATTYLDRVHATVREEVKAIISEPSHLILVMDGWSNIRNEGITNGVVCAPGMRPVLWRSVASGESQHTGEYYAQLAKQFIDEIEAVVGRGKVVGVIGDNAYNMGAAWRILQTDLGYPHLKSVGCAAHAVNLLIQAIFENIPAFGTRLDECTAISKFVKNRQAMLARLGTEQFDQETRRALSLPVATRWYTHEKCMKSVVNNKTALKSIFADQEFMSRYRTATSRSAVTQSIVDHQFWSDSEVILTLLDPISDALALLESDDSTISMVNECFSRLATHEIYNEPQATVDGEIQGLILSEIKARWRTTRSDVADVAYLLDPRLTVAAFAQDTIQDLVEKAVRLARKTEGLDDRRADTLRDAIVDFVEQKLE